MTTASPDPDSPKERILAAVGPRILRDGFSSLSVERLSADLGISKKTFYRMFSGKEQLVDAVVSGLMHEAGHRFDVLLEENEDFTESFAGVLALLGDIGGRIGKPFLEDVQRHLPVTWKRFERFRRQRIRMVFARLIERGIRQGHVRRSVNTTLFLRSYIGAVEAVVTPAVLMHEPFSAREAVQGILDIFFRGVLTPRAAQKLPRLKLHES
jgi:AcrR family transcriptional regulator